MYVFIRTVKISVLYWSKIPHPHPYFTRDSKGNIRLNVNHVLVSGQRQTESWRQSQGQKFYTSQKLFFSGQEQEIPVLFLQCYIICGVDPGWNVYFRPGCKKVSHQLWRGLDHYPRSNRAQPAILGKNALDIKFRLMEY